MKPTLLILAAGMGSRYGGLKQLDKIGASGETIMDYSVFDAINAGFGKIIFVIRKSFEQDFKSQIISKFAGKIDTKIVFQDITSVPDGCSFNPKREKPWGTNHAVLMAKDVINEPFGVINADDFYGRESYQILFDFLQSVETDHNKYCMIAYKLDKTLSENGFVSRGECFVDEQDNLTKIIERTKIIKKGNTIVYQNAENKDIEISKETLVSMNFWGFTPDYFEYSQKRFVKFLKEEGQQLKSEFYIPTMVNDLITSNTVTCKVIQTPSQWFGVTYSDDKQMVINKINKLIKNGVYPQNLWK